jgi:hypothetical protein
LFANSKAAIIYSEGTNLKDVLTSVEILTADLKHRIEMNQQETQKPILKKGKVEAVRVSQAQTTPTQEPPIAEAPT